jgi:hypothetical protein
MWTPTLLDVSLDRNTEAWINDNIGRSEGGARLAIIVNVVCDQWTRCLTAICLASCQDDLRLGELFTSLVGAVGQWFRKRSLAWSIRDVVGTVSYLSDLEIARSYFLKSSLLSSKTLDAERFLSPAIDCILLCLESPWRWASNVKERVSCWSGAAGSVHKNTGGDRTICVVYWSKKISKRACVNVGSLCVWVYDIDCANWNTGYPLSFDC